MHEFCSFQMHVKGQPKRIEIFNNYLRNMNTIYEYELLFDEEIQNGKAHLSGACENPVYKNILPEITSVIESLELTMEIFVQYTEQSNERIDQVQTKNTENPKQIDLEKLKTIGQDEHYIVKDGNVTTYEIEKTTFYFTEEYETRGIPLDKFNNIASTNITQSDYEDGMFIKHGGYDNGGKDIDYTI